MSRKRPRRRKAGAAARLRPFWMLIALLVVALGFGAYWLATWPALDPHVVDVRGNRVVPKAAILAAAHVDLQRNMWLQDANAIGRRVAAIPYIDGATVRRSLPATMEIDVTERVPFAVVASQASRVVVDRELRVLQADTPGFGSLPVIRVGSVAVATRPGTFLTAPEIQHLFADVVRLQAARVEVREVSEDRFGDLDAVLPNGVRLLLGDRRDLEEKIALIDPILRQVGRGHRPIAAIDLRAVRTPVVVYKK